MIKRFFTILMLAGIVAAAPDTGITMREGGIVRGDACVLAMDLETGIVDDLSKEGNDGVPWNTSHVTATATVSGHYTFNGVNGYLRIPNDDSLEPRTHDFTVSAWVKTTETADRCIVHGGDRANDWFRIENKADGVFHGQIDDGSTLVGFTTATTINDGAWHHVVAVFDRSANMIPYIDGQLASGSVNITSVGDVNFTTDIYVGCSYSSGGREENIEGEIDEVLIYNIALTPQEVKDLYLSGMIRHPKS